MKLRIFFFLFLLLYLLTGCQFSNDEVNPYPTSSQKTEPQKTIQLSWWGTDETHKKVLAVVQWFEQEHPEIDVQCTYGVLESWEEFLLNSIESDAIPDVCFIQSEWLETMKDSFMSLDQLNEFDLAEIPKEQLEKCMIQDQLKMIPLHYPASHYKDYSLLSEHTLSGYAISKNTKYPQECAALIKYLLTFPTAKTVGIFTVPFPYHVA